MALIAHRGVCAQAIESGFGTADARLDPGYSPLILEGRNVRLVDHFGVDRELRWDDGGKYKATEHWHSVSQPPATMQCCWRLGSNVC